MPKKKNIVLGVMAFLFFVAACVTVNIYFPAAEVQKAADKIVGEIREGETDEAPTKEIPAEGEDMESWIPRGLPDSAVFVKVAYAKMDIDLTTPAIRSLKESLKKRFPMLKPFYEAGRIGETNRGELAIRDLQDLGLKDKSQLLRLVDE